jgi:hypothetical protein
MKPSIAFLCLAHNNFGYLESLSHYYCAEGDGFYLHLDAGIGKDITLNLHKDSVMLSADQRHRTRWGTLNIIKATLALLKHALQDDKFDRFVLVSGADTPLLSKAALKEKLTDNLSYFSIWQKVAKDERSLKSKEFFNRHFYNSSLTNPGEAYLTKSIISIYTMLVLNKIIALLPNKKTFNYQTYAKGSQWWCITRELAEYIVEQLSDKDVLAQFENMHAPDEKVFQTIAINSPYLENISISNGQASPKQGVHYIDWGFQNGTNALQSFTLNDVEQAKKMGCAFARKVESDDINSFISFFETLKQ